MPYIYIIIKNKDMKALLNKIEKLETLVEQGTATMEQEVEFNNLIEQFETKYL